MARKHRPKTLPAYIPIPYRLPPAINGIPEHLLSYEVDTLEELLDKAGHAHEGEVAYAWAKADVAALARALFPYHRPDGSIDPIGRTITGQLASRWRCSGETVRRHAKAGAGIPPTVINVDTGELIPVRDDNIPIDVALAAIEAQEHGLDPIQVFLWAREHDLTAAQIRDWLDRKLYKTGKLPPKRRELCHLEQDDPTPEQVIAAITEQLMTTWAGLETPPQFVEVRIMGLIPNTDADQDAPKEETEATEAQE